MASEVLKSLKETSSEPVGKMLDRYEKRAQKGLIEKKEMERTFGIVDKALKSVKEQLKDPAFLGKLTPKEWADLSNAWQAWGGNSELSQKLFPNADQRRALASVLIENKGNKKKERALVYARQIWRTEVTATLIDLLGKDPSKMPVQKSEMVELMMASQLVNSGEDSPAEALMGSMHLDGETLKSKEVRQKIAAEMEASTVDDLNAGEGLARELKGRAVKNFRVTVGGDLLSIPEEMRSKLELKNVAFRWEEGRIYAQMKNGCQGNLVIIDFEKEAPPVAPVPPVAPGENPDGANPDSGTQPDSQPGNESESNPEPGVQPLPLRGTKESYVYSRTENGNLIPSSRQFDEGVEFGVVTQELLKDYETFGIDPFFEGLSQLNAEDQELVLGAILEKLGQRDPAKAMQMLQELSTKTKNGVLRQMKEMEKDPLANASTQAFWRLQSALLQGQHETGDSKVLPYLFEQLSAIDPQELASELQPWFESNKRSLEFFTRRSLASDMVGTAFSVMTANFDDDDQEDLDQHIQEGTSRKEWQEMFSNWNDTDEEVYVASWHVLEALRLAIAYQYPQDILDGKTVENPIKHYYEQLKNGALTEIRLPENLAGSDQVSDPLGSVFELKPGQKLDFKKYFIAHEEEFRLFEEYQNGDENLGANNIWNAFRGDQAAFLGGSSFISEKMQGVGARAYGNRKGLIESSDDILLSPPFEKDHKLGGAEQLFLAKIMAAKNTKHYDELRELCTSALDGKLSGSEATKEQIKARFGELDEEEGGQIRAGLYVALKGKGLEDADFQRMQKPDNTGFYKDKVDYVDTTVRLVLENRARIQLQAERAKPIYDKYFSSPLSSLILPFGAYGETTAGSMDIEQMVKDGFSTRQIAAMGALAQTEGWGAFDLKEENTDTAASVAKTLAEIAVIQAATAGLASGAAAAAGGARIAGLGTRAFGTGLPFAQLGGQAGAALNSTAAGAHLTGAVGRAGATGLMTQLSAANAYTGGRLALAGRNIGHAAFFVEAQHLLHGTTLNPTTAEGARDALYQVGTMASTLYLLGKVQQFTRGQTAGAQALNNGQTLTRFSLLQRATAPASRFLGRLNVAGRNAGGAAYAGVLAGEVGSELLAMHALSAGQLSLGDAAGLLSANEAEAMRDPNFWRDLMHTTGVVLGLRAIAHVQAVPAIPQAPGGMPPVAPTSIPKFSPKPAGAQAFNKVSTGVAPNTFNPASGPKLNTPVLPDQSSTKISTSASGPKLNTPVLPDQSSTKISTSASGPKLNTPVLPDQSSTKISTSASGPKLNTQAPKAQNPTESSAPASEPAAPASVPPTAPNSKPTPPAGPASRPTMEETVREVQVSELSRGDTIRIRLPYMKLGTWVKARVTETYNPTTPNGAISVEYKTPAHGAKSAANGEVIGSGVQKSVILRDQILGKVEMKPKELTAKEMAAQLKAQSVSLTDSARRLQAENPNIGGEGAPRNNGGPGVSNL
ncbi:hypothetical protein IPG41_02850 [Candidatus Peregrinibacteria bacterium]|nr:MAG: hypothetical protein IPG41_02850 [Candidatus Peregrinibacteria bacterium]